MTAIDDPGLNGHTSMLGFAPLEKVVEVVVRLSADDSLGTRSVMIMPTRNIDLGDDIHGGYGGAVVQEEISSFLQAVVETMAVSN
jgi:5'-hydroxyaverantin dehydrogenase